MSVIDDVVATVGGVEVPLLPTVVGVITTGFVVINDKDIFLYSASHNKTMATILTFLISKVFFK